MRKDELADNARAACGCDLSVGPNALHIVDGHDEAAGRAETATATPPGLTVSEDGSVLNWQGVNYVPQRAERTTATTEDAADHLITHQPTYSNTYLRYICRCGDESHWPTHAAQALADAGLLATALTRPTREQVSAAIGDAANPTQVGFGAVSIAAAVDAVLALLGGDNRG